LRGDQGNVIYFFSVKIPLKAAWFEEKIYREVVEVEEGRENEVLYRNLFGLAVKISFKTWWFSGI
jgi:hypothetical protein